MLRRLQNSVVVVPENVRGTLNEVEANNVVIYVQDPRYEYAAILQFILDSQDGTEVRRQIRNGAIVASDCSIAESAKIGPFVSIDHHVKIGQHSVIMAGSRLGPYVTIWNETIVRENTVIGGYGFGFAKNRAGHPETHYGEHFYE